MDLLGHIFRAKWLAFFFSHCVSFIDETDLCHHPIINHRNNGKCNIKFSFSLSRPWTMFIKFYLWLRCELPLQSEWSESRKYRNAESLFGQTSEVWNQFSKRKSHRFGMNGGCVAVARIAKVCSVYQCRTAEYQTHTINLWLLLNPKKWLKRTKYDKIFTNGSSGLRVLSDENGNCSKYGAHGFVWIKCVFVCDAGSFSLESMFSFIIRCRKPQLAASIMDEQTLHVVSHRVNWEIIYKTNWNASIK